MRRRPPASAAGERRLPYTGDRPTINPVLPVADLATAIEFYRRLGFEVTAYDDGYAWVSHCGWEFVHLRRVEGLTSSDAAAYVHVADADAWRAAMAAAFGEDAPLGALADMPWGLREFAVTDPFGNVIRIGHPSRSRADRV